MSNVETKKPDEYEIKKIVLKDGTEIDVDKLTHVAILKHSQKGNEYYFKITHCMRTKKDSRALSNKCLLLAHAFNMMDKHNITFEEATTIYDETMEQLREAFNKMQNMMNNKINKGKKSK